MSRQPGLILLLVTAVMIAAPPVPAGDMPEPPASVATDDAKPDYAPIVERKLDFYDFTYQTVEGGPFDLRDYAQGKSVVIVEYLAGWGILGRQRAAHSHRPHRY